MESKKGFTLIELLAVIVILAIIALIAVPIVLNIIEKARKGAAKASAMAYVKAVETYAMETQLDKTMTKLTVGENTVETLNSLIELKGEKPTSGTVTIDSKGIVTSADISTKGYEVAYNGKDYTVTKNNEKIVDAESVSLNKTSATLAVNETLQLTATINPSNTTNKTLTWTSSNTSVAIVSSTGLVTGKAKGTATITVKTSNNKTATATVEVGTGPTKVAASSTDTHKGIVYLDPTDLSKYCNASNSVSTTETKTGCMKWYIYDDSGDNYKMILDHNTTARIKWNDDNKNVAYGSSNLKTVMDALVTTSKWKVTPRLITTNEINTITGKTGFDSTSTGSWYYLDTKTQTAGTYNASTRSKYAWLYDNLYKCKSASTDFGCNVEDNNTTYELYGDSSNKAQTYGYWTQDTEGTAGSGSSVWHVYSFGNLSSSNAIYSYCGVRPVITLSKSQLS